MNPIYTLLAVVAWVCFEIVIKKLKEEVDSLEAEIQRKNEQIYAQTPKARRRVPMHSPRYESSVGAPGCAK